MEIDLLENPYVARMMKQFKCEKSKDFKPQDILKLDTLLERTKTRLKIDKYLKNIKKSVQLEFGIFEKTLEYCLCRNIKQTMASSVYEHLAYNIIQNINPLTYIKNRTLLNNIRNNLIEPQVVPFLLPYQMHPEHWSKLIEKLKYEEEKEKNQSVSRSYKCPGCKERKFFIQLIQTRSLDEPATTFMTCLNCFVTYKNLPFIKDVIKD